VLRARARAGQLALGLVAGAALLAGGSGVQPLALATAGPATLVSGRIVVAHQDGAKATDSRFIPLLETSHGPVALRLPQGLPAAPGARIAVHDPTYSDGAIVGGDLAMLGPPTVPSGDATLGPANFTPGPRKVLVLLAQISGQPAPASADAIRNIIFTAPNSANAFIQEESFGQLSLTGKLRSDGDVYGPYPIKSKFPADVCDNVGWGSDAETAFDTATGMNAETWDNVIVVFQASQCNFSGIGEIGQLHVGTGARHAWINAVLTNGVPTTSVVSHELGHNFGVDHAGGLECTDGTTRIAFSEACANDPGQLANQYLDPFDVMGSGLRQENAYHKWESGWLPSASVQTVVRSGTYLIAPEESSSSAVQLLEVPRLAGGPSYWLDFRQPFGDWFDNFFPTDPVVNGVSIRYANSSTMPHPSKSWLIDTTPDTDTFADAALGVGRTYTDAVRGVSITTVAVSPLGALVNITIPGGADTTPPGYPGGLTATLVQGALHIGWTAASDDSGPVQHYHVRRNGVLIADVYDTSAIDSAPLAGRTSDYDISAVDPAGNEGPAARIEVSVADTTSPSAPTSLAASISGSGVNLSWSPALDDVGVASYEVDRDGRPIATNVHANAMNDSGAAPGTHSYTVRAFDAAGNVGAFSAPLTVVVVGPAALPTVKAARVKTVTKLKLQRLGKHRVLLSWKAQRGAHRYQVLRAGTSGKLLAVVKKARYVDAKAPPGKLTNKRYVVRAVLSS
jgi:Metallo-peptidase family M12B Reprolysin-like